MSQTFEVGALISIAFSTKNFGNLVASPHRSFMEELI